MNDNRKSVSIEQKATLERIMKTQLTQGQTHAPSAPVKRAIFKDEPKRPPESPKKEDNFAKDRKDVRDKAAPSETVKNTKPIPMKQDRTTNSPQKISPNSSLRTPEQHNNNSKGRSASIPDVPSISPQLASLSPSEDVSFKRVMPPPKVPERPARPPTHHALTSPPPQLTPPSTVAKSPPTKSKSFHSETHSPLSSIPKSVSTESVHSPLSSSSSSIPKSISTENLSGSLNPRASPMKPAPSIQSSPYSTPTRDAHTNGATNEHDMSLSQSSKVATPSTPPTPSSSSVSDTTTMAAIYKLEVEVKKWNSIDEGYSTVAIIHDSTTPNQFRIVAISKSQQCVLNYWLEDIQYRKISDQFYHFQVKESNPRVDYGIQFSSVDTATNFIQCLEQCVAKINREPQGTIPSALMRKNSQSVTPLRAKSASVSMVTAAAGLRTKGNGSKGSTLSGQSIGSLKHIAGSFEEQVMTLIQSANSSVLNPNTQRILSAQDIWDSLQVVLYITSGEHLSDMLNKIISSVGDMLTNAPLHGTVDDKIVSAAVGLATKLVKANLIQTISTESNGVRVLAVQMAALIKFIACYEQKDKQKDKDKEKELYSTFNQLVVQLTMVTRSFIDAVSRLLNAVETLKFIDAHEQPSEQTVRAPQVDEDVDLSNIWNDARAVGELNSDLSTATLNQLICKLTTDVNYDNTFLQTFITTYQSFSKPWTVLEKLKQRYIVPDSVDKKKANAIQLRVIIALKYWVETQMNDFDEDMVAKLFNFVDNVLKASGPAESLRKLLEKEVARRAEKTRLMFTIPQQLEVPFYGYSLTDYAQYMVPDNGNSILNMFVDYDAAVIAQQLTLIDFQIYSSIDVTELLNQSWNKPKLKHRSPHVCAMIARSNRLSLWVATTIVCCDRFPQRVKVFEKMIDICTNLMELNNFNSLMAFLAGLNLSAVHRLKQTKKKIPKEKRKLLEKYLQTMSPEGSYKLYRAALKLATPPALPYIGVSLTDLTFIEDGNPDTINELINFKKREQVFTAIRELIQFQTPPYEIAKQEPLYSFLLELAYNSSEQELYDLSKYIEV